MKKKEIIEKLKDLDKDKYLIVDDTALVLYGIIKDTNDINYINLDNNNYEIINDYKVMSLEDLINKYDDKSIVKKIQLLIDCKDTYKNERELKDLGYKLIGGVDEVGRGPLVGPVVAACVVLPDKFDLDGLTDSKKLS